ncbi:MAG: PEP-CTERM sorting domain-containing protein [Armatimonadetes bacterium]|nr:PEP-CTERM sorting domain-containing protein [Armatimonadota bacterium]
MKISKLLFALTLSALSVAAAQAQIAVTYEQSYAWDARYDAQVGYLHSSSVAGPPMAFSDPTATSTYNNDLMSMGMTFNSGITTQTASFVQLSGFFSASTLAYSGSGYYAEAWSGGYDQINFTTSSAAVVTLQEYNTNANSSGDSYIQGYLDLDGILYQTSAVDGTFTINIGAGSHTAFYEGFCESNGSSYISYSQAGLTANYQISVSTNPTVPEPASMLGLSALAVGIAKRRRK